MMARQQTIEAKVEYLVRGMQHHIGRRHQPRVSPEQRNRSYADVLLERSRRIWAWIKRAVDHSPWAGRRCALHHIDRETRCHNRIGPPLGDRMADRLCNLLDPLNHSLFDDRTGSNDVATSRGHRITDRAGQSRSQVVLRWQHLHVYL